MHRATHLSLMDICLADMSEISSVSCSLSLVLSLSSETASLPNSCDCWVCVCCDKDVLPFAGWDAFSAAAALTERVCSGRPVAQLTSTYTQEAVRTASVQWLRAARQTHWGWLCGFLLSLPGLLLSSWYDPNECNSVLLNLQSFSSGVRGTNSFTLRYRKSTETKKK